MSDCGHERSHRPAGRRSGPDRRRDPGPLQRVRRRLLGAAATASTSSRGTSTPAWPRAAGSGIAIPEEYGGGGRGITDAAVMLHEIAASGAAMNGCSAVHLTVFGLNPVVQVRQRPAQGDVPPPRRGGRPARRVRRDRARRRHRHRPHHHPRGARRQRRLAHPRPQDLDQQGARVGGGAAHRAHRRHRQRPRGAQPRSSPTSTPTTSTSAPIPKVGRNAVASCEVAYDGLPGRELATARRGEQGLPATPARAQPRAGAAGVGGVRHRRGRARSRDHLRQGTHRVRPSHRRQPGDQPPARARPRPAARRRG